MSDVFDADKVIENLRRFGATNYACPICGGHKFSVQGEIATINTTNKIRVLSLGTYVPCAMMICSTCGNIQFFALPIINGEASDGVEK